MNQVGLILPDNHLYLRFSYLSQYVSERTLKTWERFPHPENQKVKIFRYADLKDRVKTVLPEEPKLREMIVASTQVVKQSNEELAKASLPEQWACYYVGTDEKFYQDNYNVNYDRKKGNRAQKMAMSMAILRFIHSNKDRVERISNTGFEKMEDLITAISEHLQSDSYYGLPTSYNQLRLKYYNYVKAVESGTDSRLTIVSKKFGNKDAQKFDEIHMAVLKEVFLRTNKPDILKSWTDYQNIMTKEFSMEAVKYSRFRQKCSSQELKVLAARCREGSSYYETHIRPFHLRKAPEYSFSLITGDGWMPGRSVRHTFIDKDGKAKVVNSGMTVWYFMDWKTTAILSYRISHSENSHEIRQSFRDILNLHNGYSPLSVMLDKKWEQQPDIARMFQKAGVFVQAKRSYNPKSNLIERQNKEMNKLHRLLDEYWVNMTPGVSRQNRHNDEALRESKPMEYNEFESMVQTIINHHNNTATANLQAKTPLEALSDHMNPNARVFDPIERLWIFGNRTAKPITVRNYKIPLQIASKKYLYIIPEEEIESFIARNVKYNKVKVYYDEKFMDTIDIYQYDDENDDTNDRFICTCVNAETIQYSAAQVEWTSDDWDKFNKQQKRGKIVDDYIKRDQAERTKTLENVNFDRASVYATSQEAYKEANATELGRVYNNYYAEVEQNEGQKKVQKALKADSNHKEKFKKLTKNLNDLFE